MVVSKYSTFVQNRLLAYKDSKLDEEYPDFKALMGEYHDGILLFNLTDELVWSKAVKDTTGLDEFYNNKKESYKWDKRVDAIVYSALNAKIADQVKAMLKKGVEIDEIIEEINRPSQLNLRYEKRKYLKGDDETVDQVDWIKGISKNIESKKRIYFVEIKEVIEPSYKTLEDSRGLITSDYQNYLEKEWIISLKEKYSYTVDKKVLKALKAELNQ
ncbi:MAG: hypothetical protein JKY48_17885 [Flavobacteriales bacterium]|nr:hypothetical protein [Flavobacteriales bacterium]